MKNTSNHRETKEIELTQGYVTVVDGEDYNELVKHKWYAHKDSRGRVDAIRNVWLPDSKTWLTIRMSRLILELHGINLNGKMVDHINHDSLDNSKDNLRVVSCQQNNFNARKLTTATSRFKGVSWKKSISKWRSRIQINGKSKYLGQFTDETEAARAYNRAAIELFGEFAVLNDLG